MKFFKNDCAFNLSLIHIFSASCRTGYLSFQHFGIDLQVVITCRQSKYPDQFLCLSLGDSCDKYIKFSNDKGVTMSKQG